MSHNNSKKKVIFAVTAIFVPSNYNPQCGFPVCQAKIHDDYYSRCYQESPNVILM